MKAVLGTTLRDIVTGFSGVVVGRVEYLTGCNQALLQPKVKEDGALTDSVWIDEQRLEAVSGVARVKLDNGTSPGFDRPAPKR
ncbi:hypothetical protein [Mesorhizobium sp. NZP2077]|uniref:hypothetical protein n=1 Tax=Mesorhizobium sp. NZP2077 TaxID=2483404 RepID=UPI001556E761|nr:hypothetical protein [Mesorhizobium sp. NZP2077]QKC83247.1 hypothetical protein EB232_17965 [Mesorhizobium sp. NZP2077]QKD16763.1 hypothetical protein HGP13_17745 [Mesorhizobium sp. NZP2077]